MGRRAADLTTPVPVLGVPALVGVRGWRTTGGDRSAGALLLQSWGPQCSVGVQTSPGISRPPTVQQLTDTLPTPSDSITQTSNSYITTETEYREILLLTRSDKEKRAILKQKNGESKTKKEVTFKALGGEASKDVTCTHKNRSGTYCFARAIKTNPKFAGSTTNAKPRYTNGSVVDSEAIGGISVHSDEAEPGKATMSRGRDQTRLEGHYAEQAGKSLMLPAVRPLGTQKKICGNCGGRQYLTTGVATSRENGPAVNACLGEKPVKSTLSMPHIGNSHNENSDSAISRDHRASITVNPHQVHLSEDSKSRKTPHPACPVHSRAHVVTLTNSATESTPTQPSTMIQAKTVTVTKATIETRQDDPRAKSSPNLSSLDRKTQQPIMTPQLATATKSNNPQSHTYPKPVKMSEHNSVQPQNVCVSVHAAPLSPPLCSYTTAAEHIKTSVTNTHQTSTAFNSVAKSTESLLTDANATQKAPPVAHTIRVNLAGNSNNSLRVAPKCSTLSRAVSASDPFHKPEAAARRPPPRPPRTSSDPGHKPQEKSSLNVDNKSSGKSSLSDISTDAPRTSSPHPSLRTVVPQPQSSKSDQIMLTSTKHKTVSVEIHLIRPSSSKSEPALHVSTASPNATKHRDSKARLASRAAATSKSTCNSPLFKNKTLRNSSISLKSSPPTASASSSALTENQSRVCLSGMSSLQSADATKQGKELGHHTNQQGQDRKTQISNEPASSGIVANQEMIAKTTLFVIPGMLRVPISQTRAVDPRNPKSDIVPNTESYADKNKFNGNLINELAVHESKELENSDLSQVSSLLNNISLMKSSSSCLQGCINTEQQRLAHYQGCTTTEQEGHCGACPPVKKAQETDLKTEKFALGMSVRRANIQLNSNAEKQKHPHKSTPPVIAQINLALENAHVHPTIKSSVHQNSDTSLPPAHAHPELSFTAPASATSKGELCSHKGPECDPILPASTMHSTSPARLHTCKAEAIIRPDSKFSPAPSRPCPEDTRLAHSHPAEAAVLLPPSPQCCKSAALQQRLETVEASLAANKDRITTLLNIIHDLETCHTPTSGDATILGRTSKTAPPARRLLVLCTVWSMTSGSRRGASWRS
ncbi:mucin-5AC-like isoform X2 [Cheilinus undulatus]|uniref:mucin-5AC-like isoform X2 n=1 Tax=Cheilinus undulatus TaxID=241271 RepID=UPI001BD4C182|nr:mucin-5AC-like isoform X2 [Cheilinus undulatus]